jgi:hypothetical protein
MLSLSHGNFNCGVGTLNSLFIFRGSFRLELEAGSGQLKRKLTNKTVYESGSFFGKECKVDGNRDWTLKIV